MTTSAAASRGGAWLLEAPASIFTPEQMSDEHRLIARTTAEFADSEVLPALDALEQKDWALARKLLKRCGELGLLGVNVPEAYGGVELDTVSSLIVSENIARSASFGATYGAQANLSILPIAMFGTDDQKSRYLPGLVAGDLIGAYALSEAGSGSDALSARARADRQPDGSFRLSGEKMWITNGGFADLFIVFAKVDGEHFSAFIVERAFGGVTSGHEEHKMGLHGSSTTPLLLQDVPVPAANLLGEVGRGHKVAFNVLNFGRFKLGAMCLGGCRLAIGESSRYAATRRQFGEPIASFGAVRHKLGEMTARTYALEALMFRTASLIDANPAAAAGARGPALLAALEEFADRGLDREDRRQRDAGLRARRERADPRRERLRARLPRRTPLPRRASEPHLRGHQRDQPPARAGNADQARDEGRPGADPGREAAARRGAQLPRAAGG